jgi:hypothetical protein
MIGRAQAHTWARGVGSCGQGIASKGVGGLQVRFQFDLKSIGNDYKTFSGER